MRPTAACALPRYIKALSTEASLSGTMDAAQNLNFTLDITDMDLGALPISDDTVALDGFVNAQGSLAGTLTHPELTAASAVMRSLLTAKNLKTFLVRLPRMAGIITVWRRRLNSRLTQVCCRTFSGCR